MKTARAFFLFLVVLILTACTSDLEWVDPEAHERTVQLNEQYGPFMVGTWHYEHLGDKQHFIEQLTFKTDGTFSGTRIWQTRSLVTIDGEEQYTYWEDVDELSGGFTGTWSLSYRSIDGGPKADYLFLSAAFDDSEKKNILPIATTCPSVMSTIAPSASGASTSQTRMDGLTINIEKKTKVFKNL